MWRPPASASASTSVLSAAANRPRGGGEYSAKAAFLAGDGRRAQNGSKRPGKITMPGPMTISDTNCDAHYDNPKKLGADLADSLNTEVLALAEAGCRHIQIDGPVFARFPDDAFA